MRDRRYVSLSFLLLALATIFPARAADDAGLTRLALCQDSWLDWTKTDPAKLQAFGNRFRTEFAHKDNDPFFTPKKPVSVAGLRVVQAFPQSVGMGVGFSLLVAAPFDQTRSAIDKALGKSVGKCETGDGMHSCELEIAQQRTVMLMAEDKPHSSQTLIGCYYYYEK
jgi:hypothetical protein